jgi:hypothetical protein
MEMKHCTTRQDVFQVLAAVEEVHYFVDCLQKGITVGGEASQ